LEGKTYHWMVAEYLRKYHVQTTVAMFSNFRRRQGLDRRTVRDVDLIPWGVNREHRHLNVLNQLRNEARRRAGDALPDVMIRSLDVWIHNLKNDGLVVHYDPDTELGSSTHPSDRTSTPT
jgi:hypothetical protein